MVSVGQFQNVFETDGLVGISVLKHPPTEINICFLCIQGGVKKFLETKIMQVLKEHKACSTQMEKNMSLNPSMHGGFYIYIIHTMMCFNISSC